MKEKNSALIKEYISNIRIRIKQADYTHCPPSWHFENICPKYNKLYFFCKGEGWLKIKGKEYHPKPGELFWLPAGETQSYTTNKNNPFVKYWCHFQAKINNFELTDFIKLPVKIDTSDINDVKKKFARFINYYNQDQPTSLLRAKTSLVEIILFFIENSPKNTITLKNSNSVQNINKILNYIENNIDKTLSVKELADIIHYHPNYFIKFFKNHLGKSPIQYIKELRLKKSKKLLISTDLDIKEIAYFSHSFKNNTGFSPSEYREYNS